MGNHAKFNGYGRLIGDPKTSTTSNGTTVTKFTIACFTTQKEANSNYYVNDLYNVTAWNKLAESAAQRLQKGSTVFVSGDMKQNKYDKQDGTTGFSVEIHAAEIVPASNTKSAPSRSEQSNDEFMP